jgi:hypothetical protein
MEKTIEVSVSLTLFFPLRVDYGTCLTRSTRCLTNIVKPKLESSTFWCLSQRIQGSLPDLTEEGSPLLFRIKRGVHSS